MIPRVSPCKDCDNRHIGCHSECEIYTAFASGRKQGQAQRRAAQRIDDLISDTQKRLKRKYT